MVYLWRTEVNVRDSCMRHAAYHSARLYSNIHAGSNLNVKIWREGLAEPMGQEAI